MILKRAPLSSLPSFYQNYSLCIPQHINQNPKDPAETWPSFQIVFQYLKGNRVYTWDYGGMADQNKTGTLNYTCSMESIFGVRTIAANQYAIFKGQ